MRKHCGNCANYKKETNQFSEECGKCVSARLENGEMTDPSHWRALPQTNADRIRAMSDEELANWIDQMVGSCDWCDNQCYDMDCVACIQRWLEKAAEVEA